MSVTPEQVQAAYARRLDPHDPEARLVLADLAEACHAGRSTEGATPADTSFRNGQRAVFLYIAGRLGLPIIGA
ncbi:MAG: hypothetical protein IT555_05965 [Acetobacteraceae bacterium]|nr:hypothetical protein [Acetobacteraceae bacterium]